MANFGVWVLGFLFLLSLSGCQQTPSGDRVPTTYIGGIQINESSYEKWAKALKDSGMNTAQVTAYAKHGQWNSDHLWSDLIDTFHIANEIRALKKEGLQVVMVLRTSLKHMYDDNEFKWHGMIFPKGRTAKEEWFKRYGLLVDLWAQVCEREGVEVFAIASEMNALLSTQPLESLPDKLEYFLDEERQWHHLSRILKYQSLLEAEDLWEHGIDKYPDQESYIRAKIRRQQAWANEVCHNQDDDPIKTMNAERAYLDSTWRTIIRSARQHYTGELTLAANFDNYREISFWDELDFIGINAYFPLREYQRKHLDDDQLKQKLVKGWETVFEEMDAFKSKNELGDKPVFFTELGYTTKSNTTVKPWKGHGYSILDNRVSDTLIIWKRTDPRVKERAFAVEALKKVVDSKKQPLVGITYWKLSTEGIHAQYEPFMLYLNTEHKDGLKSALLNFLDAPVE